MICPVCTQEHAEGSCPLSGERLLGKTLRDYTLVRELGRGREGVVLLAEHQATGLKVAVKLGPRGDAGVVRRMKLRARFANQLALETVVNVFDFDDQDPLGPNIVMEYVQGDTLLDVARRGVSPEEALRLTTQIAEALSHAHERGIVHAALTPANVFRTVNDKNEGLVKLLPFGVGSGRRVEGEELEDRAVAKLGSPDFRAPEQTLGAPPSPSMDVYSLGALSYLLATGATPFSAPTLEGVARAHAEVTPAAPHRVAPGISRAWSAVIMRALEKWPEQRYRDGGEFAEALRAAAASADEAALTSSSTTPSSGAPGPIAAGLADGFVVTTKPTVMSSPSRGPDATEVSPFVTTTTPAPLSVLAVPRDAQSGAPARQAPGLVLQVAVSTEKGEPLGAFSASSVTSAGLIVCTTGAMPPLLSRVKLTFTELPGLSCDAQVVNYVTAEQAAQWKLSAGYGVQFLGLSAAQRSQLATAHQALRPPETESGIARRPDDPTAAEVLRRFAAMDAYAVLSISRAAPFDALRDRVRDARRALDGLGTRLLSLAQQKALEAARARLDEVSETLTTPLRRLEHDASLGNFEGVARCISAGVSVAELEAARTRFLQRHPDAGMKSQGSLAAAQTLEARGHIPQALEAYADALKVDPLNLSAQQRYWAVRRQLGKA